MTILISFCIPTYNRADYLGKLLESITSQADESIEIVISDNASTDNTDEIVDFYKKIFPSIVFKKSKINYGADKNLLKAVSHASGKFCRLFGSDDILEPGGLLEVKRQINVANNIAGMSVNISCYTRDLSTKLRDVKIARGKISIDSSFKKKEECFSSLGLYFGYFSGQIINRSLWHEAMAKIDVESNCNGFILVLIIGKMLELNPNWNYVNYKCVGHRAGNDSILLEIGLLSRQILAHKVFMDTVSKIWPIHSEVYIEVLKTALYTYGVKEIVGIKIGEISFSLQYQLLKLYTKIYGRLPYYWLLVFPILISPPSLIRLLKFLYGLKNRAWQFSSG